MPNTLASSAQRAALELSEDDLALPSLLSSRICHDLISPVNALSNGVEFMSGGVDQDGRDQAMRIIADSARQATARLQYYRASFGAGGALGDSARLSALKDLAQEFLFGSRVTLDWESSDETLEREPTRLMLNLILLGFEAMPRGGVLRVGALRKDVLTLIVLADGPMIRMPENRRALFLTGRTADGERMEPKDAPALLTRRLADQQGAELHLSIEDGRATIAATL